MLEQKKLLSSQKYKPLNKLNNRCKIFVILFLFIYIFIINFFLIYYRFNQKKMKDTLMNKYDAFNKVSNDNQRKITNKSMNITKINDNIDIKNDSYEIPVDENLLCKKYDPFRIIENRLKNTPFDFCHNNKSNHICYCNSDFYFRKKNGLICKMTDIIIDPSKWRSSGLNFEKGPIDFKTKGFPLLSKGFFNINCKLKTNESFIFNKNMYSFYINSWNYDYKPEEECEELAPNKTIFFVSRNQDSPNIFFGGAGIINALALMNYLDLKPENIQVIFLESMFLNTDPSYIFYKYLISRGGEPIHIRNLTKKYHISSAIHVPIMWDTPLVYTFEKIPNCKYQSKGYYYLNKFINKYINIKDFHDNLNFDKEIFYYSKKVKNPNSSIYKKFLTFQWRRQFPKGRKGQNRILGNGPEIVEKLVEKLPKDILVRLVDTAKLSIIQQISIMRKTDYFLGIHGAGLFLSVFMPQTSILHEISMSKKRKNLLIASNLSGHKTYSDVLKAKIKKIDDCKYNFYDPNLIVSKVLNHMKESNFF